jgi:hypothetical protein
MGTGALEGSGLRIGNGVPRFGSDGAGIGCGSVFGLGLVGAGGAAGAKRQDEILIRFILLEWTDCFRVVLKSVLHAYPPLLE